MRFHADLHMHSRYAMACSKDSDLEHLTWWARRKGVTLMGTGDFTHPAWRAELADKLVPAEPGLFRARDDDPGDLPPNLAARPVRWMLSVEVCTVYRDAGRARKIHHLLYVRDLAAATALSNALDAYGNLASDGRPTVSLSSRDLLELTLGVGGYLVPAHAWTPWFGVLGSRSGYDSIEEAYGDLAGHVFALETGLSSDPGMNWRVSGLDRFQIVSYSDAHSPPIVGRETTLLDTELSYDGVLEALRTGEGLISTLEFFPERGKYHVDGHRKCGVRLEPQETRRLGGRCPVCGKNLTVGVLSRVEDLADRPDGVRPRGRAGFRSLVPLPDLVAGVVGVGPRSKRVHTEIDRLTAVLGPELHILADVPVERIAAHHPVLAEAVARLRERKITAEPGFDGEFGVIHV